MNKMISAAAAMLLAAAAFTACGSANTVKNVSSSDTPATTAQTSTTTEPVTTVQLETVRARDIVSDDEVYDYEIYQGGAILTKYKGNDAYVTVPSEIGGAPVNNIGFYCFEAKYDLAGVVLPDTITTISEFAFSDCANLASINIPDSVTEIQRGAFAACSSLTQITLPAAVSAVREEAFTGCASLVSLTVMNPDVEYENWGLEELPALTVYSPEGSKLGEKAKADAGFNWLPV